MPSTHIKPDHHRSNYHHSKSHPKSKKNPPITMQAHTAVSSGYTAALHLWMFLYFLVQGEIIDELVTGS
jgi:hypothetical protein